MKLTKKDILKSHLQNRRVLAKAKQVTIDLRDQKPINKKFYFKDEEETKNLFYK